MEKTLIAITTTDKMTVGEALELAEIGCDVVVNDGHTVRLYQ